MTDILRSIPFDDGSSIRYRAARIPRVVEVPETADSCRLLPPPVQIVRNATPAQKKAFTTHKPTYLLMEFEHFEVPQSVPFADLGDLG